MAAKPYAIPKGVTTGQLWLYNYIANTYNYFANINDSIGFYSFSNYRSQWLNNNTLNK